MNIQHWKAYCDLGLERHGIEFRFANEIHQQTDNDLMSRKHQIFRSICCTKYLPTVGKKKRNIFIFPTTSPMCTLRRQGTTSKEISLHAKGHTHDKGCNGIETHSQVDFSKKLHIAGNSSRDHRTQAPSNTENVKTEDRHTPNQIVLHISTVVVTFCPGISR